MSIALFIFGVLMLLVAVNVHWPPSRWVISAPAFFTSWIAGELPLHCAGFALVVAAVLGGLGGLQSWPGAVGLVLLLPALGLFVWAFRRQGEALPAVRALFPDFKPRSVGWPALVWPFIRPDRDLLRTVLRYGELSRRLAVDIYTHRTPVEHAPVLVFVHGGGWVSGFKRFQGRPLIRRLARAGWVCVSVGYRLSPRATFPAQIIDVKAALRWVRENVGEHGGDPDRIILHGNSAGAHLVALAALTPGYSAWQPGHPGDTRQVLGCVPCYGIYDLTHRQHQWSHRGLRKLWEILVMKQKFAGHESDYAEASPWEHVTPEAPPFLVVQGSADTLVPVTEARAFVAHFETVAPGRCSYLEVPGAQHAFDTFASRRVQTVVEAIACYCEGLASDARERPGRFNAKTHRPD
jgi:acetyl esterase/lipase